MVLGGRKVAIRRPRVRRDGAEVPLPTFQLRGNEDPLNRRIVEQMLVGVATRQYARSLEPLPGTMTNQFNATLSDQYGRHHQIALDRLQILHDTVYNTITLELRHD